MTEHERDLLRQESEYRLTDETFGKIAQTVIDLINDVEILIGQNGMLSDVNAWQAETIKRLSAVLVEVKKIIPKGGIKHGRPDYMTMVRNDDVKRFHDIIEEVLSFEEDE